MKSMEEIKREIEYNQERVREELEILREYEEQGKDTTDVLETLRNYQIIVKVLKWTLAD